VVWRRVCAASERSSRYINITCVCRENKPDLRSKIVPSLRDGENDLAPVRHWTY